MERFINGVICIFCEIMGDDIDFPEEEVSCMFLEGKKIVTADEQLALFMHRFNLDRDTVESMPAFKEHCKVLFSREIEK